MSATSQYLRAIALGTLLSCAPLVGPPSPIDRPNTTLPADLAEQSVLLQISRHERVLAVSYAIRTQGVALCGDQIGPILGLAVWRENPLFSVPFARALSRLYGLDSNRIAVVAVLPDSPAGRAGVRVGDHIVAVERQPVWTEFDVFNRARSLNTATIGLTVQRDGTPIDFSITAIPGCHHEAFLEMDDLMLTDATAGDHFYVTSGFVRFAETDDELALVIAHEIAHRLAGMTAMRGPAVEIRADQLGLYLAALAGFDVSIAPAFWDRVAFEQPWSLSNDVEPFGWSRVPPHGYMPSRAAAIRNITESIRKKSERGERLRPDSR